MSELARNFAKPGEPSNPQERKGKGHDGQPQPPEAKQPPPGVGVVSTTDDPADHNPLAGAPIPAADREPATDSDERSLKPLLRGPNNRAGGG